MATPRQIAALEAFELHGSYGKAALALGRDKNLVFREARIAREARELAQSLNGQVRIAKTNPAPAGVRTYILTCAQNNTRVHARFLRNLIALKEHTNAELKIARFSYNKAAFGVKAIKPGKQPDGQEELWFDPAIEPYVCDDPARHGSCRWRLAPDLLWCAEMNILPTAVRPLSGLDGYSGASSGIFPHAKIALESLPGAGGAKFNYTTGACTLRNYIQKKEGIKAEFHHAYGALIVEVAADGNWWARHINATNDGNFYDLDRHVKAGRVRTGVRAEAINWGDVHASEIDQDVRELNWRKGGILDKLKPRYQLMHDLFSMRSRSHHEAKSYEQRLLKHGTPLDSVEGEVKTTAGLLKEAARPWCETVVVCSNHDRHGERWLEEADYRLDPLNSEFFLEAQLARTKALKTDGRWQFLPWAMRREGAPGRFLAPDERFTVAGVECGWHGDRGPNGARGTTQNLLKVAARINKGHDHTLAIRDGVASAAACVRKFNYEHGPSSHSISHLVTYRNGKRAGLTQRAGKCWR